MPNPYFNPGRNPYDMGTAVDFEVSPDAFPKWKPDPGTTFNWADQEEKEPTFGERFSDALKEGVGSYTKRFAGAGEKTGGNITSVKAAGDTVADLGGGNTLFAPDTTTAMRMAQAGQQQQESSGGFGRMAGSILGQAGGTALASSAGLGATTFLGAAAGPFGALLGAGLGSLLPF